LYVPVWASGLNRHLHKMSEEKTICSLDYLTGTFATAYRGVINSLVLKDFCMLEKDDSTIFKGTIFSIPEGDYVASLIHEGVELSRTRIHEGYFELRSEAVQTGRARNLQIDILQNGRHIGTFLLKKEKREGVFISALELSQEIGDINFGLLTGRLRSKVGLLNKADDIISGILSTKQDWKKLSEKINSFSNDLFWSDRESFYLWYDVFVRWSVKACERIGSAAGDKAISNVLSLIELPLEREEDRQKLGSAADLWLIKVTDSAIDFSGRPAHAKRVFAQIHEVLPQIDIRPALKGLVTALDRRLRGTPVLSIDVLLGMKDTISPGDYNLLCDYSEERKKGLLDNLSHMDSSLDTGEYSGVFEALDSMGSWLSKDNDMITIFYDIIDRNITHDNAEGLADAYAKLFSLFDELPDDTYKRMGVNMGRLIRKLAGLGRSDICKLLLADIEHLRESFRTDITLNPEFASAILYAGDDLLTAQYNRTLERILIPAPGISGFSYETWAEVINPLHLQRLTQFLRILRLDGRAFRQILVQVICNLYIGGVFIPDDRLFQREVSAYLNSVKTGEDYLLHYMLLKRLPVYYHDVGATGRLRDDTTEIDSWGNDTILYFIRKQTHVNASNHLIHIVGEVIRSWVYNDPGFLTGVVPGDVLKTFQTDLLRRYSDAVRPLFESCHILDQEGLHLERIPELHESDIDHMADHIKNDDEMKMKVLLMCRIYRGLVKKYSLISRTDTGEDIMQQLTGSVRRLIQLKAVIVSEEKTMPEESLYFKRHIAFGIPSVMGSYHEPKFDALGESLRIEERIRVTLDSVIAEMRDKENDFSPDGFRRWVSLMGVLNDLLLLHGLGNFQIDEALATLEGNGLHISQISDVLRTCLRELTWMVEFLNRTFHRSIVLILKIFPGVELLEHLRGLDREDSGFLGKATDVITRDIMSSIAGFFEFDRVLNAAIDVLDVRMKTQSDEIMTLSSASSAAGAPKEWFMLDTLTDDDAMRFSPLIGNKAKNLAYLHNKGLHIPYGAVFPASHTTDYIGYTQSERFRRILHESVMEIEKRTGAVFGSAKNPLFLSVRSGSYVSMPGILSSILYCGMNEETVSGFIENTGNEWLARDSYRRFIEHYGTVVLGIDIDVFERTSDMFLRQADVTRAEDLTAGQMKEIVSAYNEELRRRGLAIPGDVFEQLKQCVKAVYGSWYAERAIQFRKAMGISDYWGTSVTLMQMIYGNDTGSGASVFFTRKPFSHLKGIYGETRERATGSELVYGRSLNQPITRQQAFGGQKSLEETDLELFRMHEELAFVIETAMRGLPQEVEVTYTKQADYQRVIYVLQTRRMEFHRGFVRRFDDICRMESRVIGRGAGVFGGALSGIATFSDDPARIREIKKERNLPVILLRKEASTDDVLLMPEVDGIITATGGATSHAAILAQKFNVTAVVGCSEMKLLKDPEGRPAAMIGRFPVEEGSVISIDGSTGIIYSGLCSAVTRET
jgi:pyruvate,orthophosphate dikinase